MNLVTVYYRAHHFFNRKGGVLFLPHQRPKIISIIDYFFHSSIPKAQACIGHIIVISTTKLSARTLLRGTQFFLRQYDKYASQGKQSMKRLMQQNRGVTNVEIQKTGIKDFDRYAKRYHIDYAIQKDLSCTPPRYMIYFKAQDTDALSAAFKEYSASVLDKSKRPSVLAKLHDLAQTIANLPDKVRHKEEGRGL